ncbi:MAG: VWA domain-containing protein [Bacteroidota bacterium]
MSWNNSLGSLEGFFILLFLLGYILYIVRTWRIATRLRSPWQNVVFKLILRSLWFALLIMALLGPSIGEAKKEVKAIGKDIYIAVDLSISMNAGDVQPTRLQKVKAELRKLVQAFSTDRLGLIIFSGDAFIQCPLTEDENILNLLISTLNTGLVPRTGTDFGPPLQLALDKLTGDESQVSRQTSKIILLISDGEDFGEDTEDVAEKIREAGISLYTLGVGTPEGAMIPVRNGFKKDRQGNLVTSQLNPADLKDLATMTGGRYFEISSGQNDIGRLIATIETIEGELRDAKEIDVSANRYYYFLALALALLALDVLLNIKVIKL